MKKLVLLLAVAFSVSMFSCGGNADAEKAAADTVAPVEEVAVVEETVVAPVDSAAADTAAVAEVPAEAAQ